MLFLKLNRNNGFYEVDKFGNPLSKFRQSFLAERDKYLHEQNVRARLYLHKNVYTFHFGYNKIPHEKTTFLSKTCADYRFIFSKVNDKPMEFTATPTTINTMCGLLGLHEY